MKGKAPQEQKRLEQLEEAAQSLGIEIRYEPFKGENPMAPGGLCRLKGNYLLILNSRSGLSEKINAIATAISRFDLSGTYLRPELREFLEGPPAPKDDPTPDESPADEALKEE
jgi:signal recognition particle subunit SEC65